MLFTSENFVISDLTYKWWGTGGGGSLALPALPSICGPVLKLTELAKLLTLL